MYMHLTHLYVIKLFNVIVDLMSYICYTPLVNQPSTRTPTGGARKRGDRMSKKRAHSFEESSRQIEEVLEQKPDRDALEKWASHVLFKLEEIHEDVKDLQDEVAYVRSQVDDL